MSFCSWFALPEAGGAVAVVVHTTRIEEAKEVRSSSSSSAAVAVAETGTAMTTNMKPDGSAELGPDQPPEPARRPEPEPDDPLEPPQRPPNPLAQAPLPAELVAPQEQLPLLHHQVAVVAAVAAAALHRIGPANRRTRHRRARGNHGFASVSGDG